MTSYVNTSSIIGLSASLSALTLIAVVLRFAVRVGKKQGLGADDWCMVPALVFTIGIAVCMIYGASMQVLGFPMGNITLDEANAAIILTDQLEFAIFLMNVLALGATKLSIVFFYRRIFVTGNNKKFNIFSWVMISIIALWIAGFFFAFLFQCGTNVALQWGAYQDVVEYCAFIPAINSTWVGSDVLVDLILFVMPIPLIWRLNMSWQRRVGVIIVFAFGALALVTSIIRVVIFGILFSGIDSDFVAPQDIDFSLSIFLYWTMFGTGIAAITACLPTFQILLRQIPTDSLSKSLLGFFSLKSLFSLANRFTVATDSDVKHAYSETNSSEYINETSIVEMKSGKFDQTTREVDASSL